MVAVVIGLVLIVSIAAGIVAMVAAPRLRKGEELLTPGGKQTIVKAGQQAREQSAAAAGTTWHWVSSLHVKLSSIWSPVSRALHEQFDRLEGESQPPMRHVTGPHPERAADAQEDDRLEEPLVPAAGAPAVGRPRQMPDESGPIPIDDEDGASSRRAPGDHERAAITVRGSEPDLAPQRPRRISPDVTTRRIR